MKSEEIANQLIEDIKQGNYLPGGKIPSEKELSDIFKASRMTVRKGIEMAINRGYLYSLHGKGTYVINEAEKIEIDLNDLQGFTKRALRLGKVPSSKVLVLSNRPSTTQLNQIFQADLEEIFYMERVRYMDSVPLAIEYAYIHPDYIGDISLKDVTSSLTDYIKSQGIPIKKIKKEMKAVIPTTEVMNSLELTSNTPVIRIDFYKYQDNGQMLEYAKVFYNQSLFKFVQYMEDDNL